MADLLSFRDSDRVLIIEFQRQEIEVLVSKLPKRITFTLREKSSAGPVREKTLRDDSLVVTVVSPRTFMLWVKIETDSGSKKEPKRKPGRLKSETAIRVPIVKITRETG